MAARSIRSGASAIPEANVLQFVTDLLKASGVFDITGTMLQVTGHGSNLSVDVAAGRAYLLASGGNGYPVIWDASVNVTINANASGNPRITSIVAYKNLSLTPNSDDSNTNLLLAVDGTPAGSPSAPSAGTIQAAVGASNPYIILSNVTVASGASVITTGNCLDVRQAAVFAFGTDGWTILSTSLTYASTDGHTFVANTSSDVTGIVQLGDRIKLTNQSALQYFIVTAITSSTITLYGGTTYSITNTAITLPSYSHAKTPFGFNTNPSVWTESSVTTSDNTQTSASASTWYNPGTIQLAIPIGAWNVNFSAPTTGIYATQGSTIAVYTALSTSNSSVSDTDLQGYASLTTVASTIFGIDHLINRQKAIILTSKTPYFLICQIAAVSGSTTIGFEGSKAPIIIRSVCAYL